MTSDQQKHLGKVLWDIADDLRGAMNADDFRDYMLAFLFLRYLSANYEKGALDLLKEGYPPNNGHITPLQRWYEENPDDVDVFEEGMRTQVLYVVHPNYLWGNIVDLALRQDESLQTTLRDGLKHIEEKSFGDAFHGLFSEINLDSEKLGKSYPDKNKRLCGIVTKIAAGLDEFSTDIDTLGDAYEYLIGQFAAGGGKKAGEFYTPQQISTILSLIVASEGHDAAREEKAPFVRVLDFACGSGSLLLNARQHMQNGRAVHVYGQESNITTYNLARMNMLLHGVEHNQFRIHHGDTLRNDWDAMPDKPTEADLFDAVVANPPFSLRWDPTDEQKSDIRFKDYGIAPRSAADFAFLLHGFHYLKKDGTMAIILPHGVLFRGGVEERIRTKLIDDGNIDAVIGLPSNLFYSTSIPVCILVLKKCTRPGNILFINAAEHYQKGKRQNSLREEDIDKIIDTYRNRQDEDRYARAVSFSEIIDNGYNLNITRYVSTALPEEQIDLQAVHKKLQELAVEEAAALSKHNAFLKELGLRELSLPELP